MTVSSRTFEIVDVARRWYMQQPSVSERWVTPGQLPRG
jgi:hypothetical protein